MSTFVEIGPDEYDDAAFSGFDASDSGFVIGNARALMWLAQLAYETHQPSTIQVVSGNREDCGRGRSTRLACRAWADHSFKQATTRA